jgi:hypothetical protein
MQVVEKLEGSCISLLGPFDGLLLAKLIALWSFRVRQIVFSGRNRCDAA